MKGTDAFIHCNDAFDGIDILVNNAGITGSKGFIEDIDLADWEQCMVINIDRCFLMVKGRLPGMKKQKHGSIVNITSTASIFAYPMRAPYAASKCTIIGLTKTIAIDGFSETLVT